MATYQQIVSERKKYLRTLRPKFRKVDAAIEKCERKLNSILGRKRKVPEPEDLDDLMTECGNIAEALNIVVNDLKKGYLR